MLQIWKPVIIMCSRLLINATLKLHTAVYTFLVISQVFYVMSAVGMNCVFAGCFMTRQVYFRVETIKH